MKRSNLIFFIFIGILFITPLVIMGIFYLTPKETKLTGLGSKHHIYIIENNELSAENVKIEQFDDTTEPFEIKIDNTSIFNKYTSIYYKGTKNYLPSIREEGKTLIIGKPQKETSNEKLTLHIKSNLVKKVILNGTEIWNNGEEESADGYSFVPELTEKIDAFVEYYASLQK
ncbi:hypothetical protein M2459_001031 [Parabacteroides sp. PF5-5]|uniref:hypothetical protein n=1 Tax=unclassified Parabacteroides TaxID=2649774 RepID=UPI00247511E1|nr:MULTISPECIES: hypothetical protein [unclassified Parabacteroides]MDH6304299.1 hypothetical protein [Parabacteroides sp. PH5-39]MDH6315548.1 hypothetical protein [Parabacteroides sp. PF5-13]MDH6318958.1 hypothetical protein [Parabacteroides sp. PH5-13]MDH6322687.1 hypothetical protein [Parabacteroides sp. PH5-8]MDH6326741.1 hypothetical protein [Parabacteroides sp. PH5-41]